MRLRMKLMPGSLSMRTIALLLGSLAVKWGQGTLTGLVQMVAEELACDWDKVTWEFPTPGQRSCSRSSLG